MQKEDSGDFALQPMPGRGNTLYQRKYTGSVSHDDHDTYKLAQPSSANPSRWCMDCEVAFNPVLRDRFRREQLGTE